MALTWTRHPSGPNGRPIWSAYGFNIHLLADYTFRLDAASDTKIGAYPSLEEAKAAADIRAAQSIAKPADPQLPTKFLSPFQVALEFTGHMDDFFGRRAGRDETKYTALRNALLTMVAKEGLAAVKVIARLLVVHEGRDPQTAEEMACQMLVAAREDEYKDIKGLPRYPDPWRTAVDEALIAEGLDCLAPDALPSVGLNKLIKHVKDEVLAECQAYYGDKANDPRKAIDRVASLTEAFSDTAAKGRYNNYINNHPVIHTNRFPTWAELDPAEKDKWRNLSYHP